MAAGVGVDLHIIFAEAAFFIGEGTIDQPLELFDFERFELKNLRARDERAVDVKERIVSSGPDQAQIAALHVRQKNVLLRFVEMMNLVHEHDGAATGGSPSVGGGGDGAPHICHVAFDTAEPDKFGVGHVRDDPRQRCFAGPGRTRQDDRGKPVGFDGAPQ